MKCQNCGSETIFTNGIAVCTACNTQYKINHTFENAEVCICYIENDNNGRRTKDSILSQELYQKLEAKNIRTFYERASASDLADDDLEQIRYSAIYSANVILVVGTSVENFEAISEKYGQYFANKTVIPFCADTKPADIPSALSKIQAIDYTSIGWESDLIKGVLRILGREAEIEQQEKKTASRKLKVIIIGIIAAICLIAIGIFVFVDFNKAPQTKEESSELTNQQIYENAQELYNDAKYADALTEFVKIRDYKDSAQQIKTILNLYDGYYQTADKKFSAYFSVLSDSEILVELTTVSDYGTADATIEGTWTGTKNTYSLTDTFANSGEVTLTLQNDGINILTQMEKTGEFASIGNQNVTFKFTDKTDREQITRITGGLLMSWLKTPTTKETLVELGLIEGVGRSVTDAGGVVFYDAVHTLTTDQNVTVLLAPSQESIYDDSNSEQDIPQVVFAISAPAKYLIPDKVNTAQKAFFENDTLFVPNGNVEMFDYLGLYDFIHTDANIQDYNTSDETIQPDTPVTVIYRKIVGNDLFIRSVRQCVEIEDKIELDSKLYGNSGSYLREDDDAYIMCGVWYNYCMYKIDKKTFEIVEAPNLFTLWSDESHSLYSQPSYDSEVIKSLQKDQSYHIQETKTDSDGKLWGKLIDGDGWICMTDTCEASKISDWKEKVEARIEDKAIKMAKESYPGELSGWNSHFIAAENDTHILFYVRTQPLAETYKCAWYKGNKQTGEVTFLRTGPYLETPLQPGEWTTKPLKIVDYIWFREYRDFAKEFPSLHGDPDSSENFYASSPELPYLLNSDKRPLTFNIFAEPAYGYVIGTCLESGKIHTIIEEQYDAEYNLWGKLSDGSGWVCVSEIVSKYPGILSSH